MNASWAVELPISGPLWQSDKFAELGDAGSAQKFSIGAILGRDATAADADENCTQASGELQNPTGVVRDDHTDFCPRSVRYPAPVTAGSSADDSAAARALRPRSVNIDAFLEAVRKAVEAQAVEERSVEEPASAAEIVSGAVQDMDRGVVVGQRTQPSPSP